MDLNLYISAMDYLADLEAAETASGEHQATRDWVERQGFDREEAKYVYEGIARLWSDSKSDGWENRPRDERLDAYVWAYHRAWIDRYGYEPTNARGLERYRN